MCGVVWGMLGDGGWCGVLFEVVGVEVGVVEVVSGGEVLCVFVFIVWV